MTTRGGVRRRLVPRAHAGVGVLLAAGILAGLPAPAGAERLLRMTVAAEPSTLDPHLQTTTPNLTFATYLFDRLVHRDSARVFVPGLATGWREVTPGTWHFQLRTGVVFHDGRPLNADDVVFTAERIARFTSGPGGAARFLRGKRITRVDDLTVAIASERPEALLLADLATLAILPRPQPGRSDLGPITVGTGPYRLASAVAGDRIELLANREHWSGVPPWDRVLLRAQRIGPARIAALLAGDTDVIDDVPIAELARLRSDPRVVLTKAPSNRLLLLNLDQWREATPFANARDGSAIRNPFRNSKVRRAVALAVDREALVTKVMDGHAQVAAQLLPPNGSPLGAAAKGVGYDPERARRLLAEAGFPNGFKVTLHGPAGRYPNDVRLIEAIAQMLTRVGIETTVESLPPSQFFNRADAGADGQPEFSLFLTGMPMAKDGTAAALRSLLAGYDRATGDGALNRGRYASKAFDDTLDQALRSADPAAQRAGLERAADLALADQAVVPLLFPNDIWAARAGLVVRPPADDGLTALTVSRATD